jgi:SGNH domain (fused to AT3 domains)
LAIPSEKQYVLGDVPFFGGNGGHACLAAQENDVQACSASEATAIAPLKATADRKAAKQTHAVYISTTPWFCAQSMCYAVIGKFDVFPNKTDHITATYSRFLSRALQAALGLR